MTGKELKTKLQSTGRTITDISNCLGMSPQALNTIFNVSDVKTGILERLCEALCLPMSFFYPEGTTIIDKSSTCKNTSNNNVRTQRARNMHNGTGDINDHTQQATSKDDALMALIQQNQQLIDIIKNQNK